MWLCSTPAYGRKYQSPVGGGGKVRPHLGWKKPHKSDIFQVGKLCISHSPQKKEHFLFSFWCSKTVRDFQNCISQWFHERGTRIIMSNQTSRVKTPYHLPHEIQKKSLVKYWVPILSVWRASCMVNYNCSQGQVWKDSSSRETTQERHSARGYHACVTKAVITLWRYPIFGRLRYCEIHNICRNCWMNKILYI